MSINVAEVTYREVLSTWQMKENSESDTVNLAKKEEREELEVPVTQEIQDLKSQPVVTSGART